MKSTRHLFCNSIYHISNRSVSSNPLCINPEDQEFFETRMRDYLEPVCHILTFRLYDDHYRILIRMKDELEVRSFFEEKYKGQVYEELDVPHESYIFSQQMSNFQVSYAKKMNFKYSRSGGLFAHRFDRKLMQSEEMFDDFRESINSGQRFYKISEVWRHGWKVKWHGDHRYWEADGIVDEVGKEEKNIGENPFLKDNLVGCILKPQKLNILSPLMIDSIKIFRKKYKFAPHIN